MGANPSDFFERRDQSRQRTAVLVFFFFLSVAATVLAVYLVSQLIISKTGHGPGGAGDFSFAWDWYWFWRIGAFTVSIILGGTIYRLAELMSGGGPTIASMLGATAVDPATRDPLLRRLLNIMEEMSIASGAPVPSVYVLKKERGINAFAAGLGFEDAVIAVTDGALRRLTREELQGVVAHEFSHVLNGDSKLNVHLMGWLNGIMMISAVGRVIMRVSLSGGEGRRGGVWFGAVAGLILFLLGLIGYFFARIIQMAVSRQREHLADASAVQFTRNPLGLAGALKKIGGFDGGARIDAPNAEQAAHIFFGEALSGGLFRLWSTHPPLEERIRLLDPGWRGDFLTAEPVEVAGDEALNRFMREESVASVLSSADAAMASRCAPEAVAASVGRPDLHHYDAAGALLSGANPLLLESARTGGGAMALVCALLVDGGPEVRKAQLLAVERMGGAKLAEATRRLSSLLGAHGKNVRLPLVDLCLPAIRKLDNQSLHQLLSLTDELIAADGRVEPFEAALRAIVVTRVKKLLGVRAKATEGRAHEDLSTLLSVLSASAGEGKAEGAFSAAIAELGPLSIGVSRREVEPGRAEGFDVAAGNLAGKSYADKRAILKAMVAAAASDGAIGVAEAELVRAGAELMGVPVPPLICSE